jgi:thymidylate synthase
MSRFFQFYVAENPAHCTQRSADISEFRLILHRTCSIVYNDDCSGFAIYKREFIHTFGDAHIYNNYFEQPEFCNRDVRPLPKHLNPEIKKKYFLILL